MASRPLVVGDEASRFSLDSTSSELSAALRRPVRPDGEPTQVVYEDGYMASVGQLVRADPSKRSFSIQLPQITPFDIGRSVVIANVSSSTNTVTILPFEGQINGNNSYSIAAGYFVRKFMAIDADRQLWLDYTADLGANSSGLPTPWWEWNGVDTSQFDASVDGESTTAVTWSVVNKYGLNWIKGAITTAGAASPYAAGGNALHYGSILPISQTPPSADYIVTAEVKFDLTISAAKGGAAMVMRYVNGATCYCYTAGRYSANTAESYYFGAARDLTPDQLYRVASFAVTENHAPVMYDESGGFFTQYSGFHLKGGIVGEMLMGSGGGNNWCTSPISTSMAFWTGYAVNSSAGQAGILATNTGATTGTCEILFRNIRCYNASMIGVL